MSNIFNRIFNSLKEFLFPTPEQKIKKLVKQKEKIDLKIKALEKKIKPKPKPKQKDLGLIKEIEPYNHVEMYVTIKNEQVKNASMDGGYILINCSLSNTVIASDILKNMPILKIKDLLRLRKEQVILEVHHGISKSSSKESYLDVNGNKQNMPFDKIIGVLK